MYDPGPEFWGQLESELRSGFRDRNKEIEGSGVAYRKAKTLRSGVLGQN